jgi:allantoin racemase
VRICFLNPFGTDAFDELLGTVLEGSARPGTRIDIWHLDAGPRNIDYYAPKQLVQVEILRAALKVEEAGYDALIIGCMYDPALTEARELLTIPVIGPMETAVGLSRAFGHRYAILTDHHKAIPELRDRIRIYGAEPNCVGIEAVGWFVDDMVKDYQAVAADVYREAQALMNRCGAETIIVGCTIVAACYELAASRGEDHLNQLSVINPNVLAVKAAESFADLAALGQYRISRARYYQHLRDHNPAEAAELDELWHAL